MEILQSDTKLEAQNGLLNVLNYEKYELVKLLLENRETIYYCTKYHQSKNEKQKEQILDEMRQRDINLTAYTQNETATNSKKEIMKPNEEEHLHIP